MSDPPPEPHGDAPNAFVAEQATFLGLLPLDEVALLGVAGSAGDMRALIRMPGGAVFCGKRSERTAIGTLIEVSAAGVVVELPNGNATFLGIVRHA